MMSQLIFAVIGLVVTCIGVGGFLVWAFFGISAGYKADRECQWIQQRVNALVEAEYEKNNIKKGKKKHGK